MAGVDAVVRFAPTRLIARAFVANDIARITAAGFDGPFYLSQIGSTRRRRWASRDAALHYVAVGWRESRAPTPRFDPVFYRARNNDCRGNPFLHFLARRGEEDLAQNEIENLARSPQRSASRRVLVFHHARGGGSTKFLALFEDDLLDRGFEAVRLRKVVHSDRLLVLDRDGRHEVHDIVHGLPKLLEALASLSIERILVSHVVDLDPERIFNVIAEAAAALGSPIDVILHDYFCVCPRINLVDYRGRSCLPIPEASACRRCIETGQGDIGTVDPAMWRQAFSDFLMRADRVLTPSDDVRQRLADHLPRAMEVWQPEQDEEGRIRVPRLGPDEVLRIVVVGGLNAAKGSHVIARLGAAIQARRAPVTIGLIGESPDEHLLRKAGVTVQGRYRDDDLGRLLESYGPHVGFIPAIWPETWSFVLTQLLRRGLPTFAFDLGAPSERLKRVGLGDLLLAPGLIDRPDCLLDIFLAYRDRCQSS